MSEVADWSCVSNDIYVVGVSTLDGEMGMFVDKTEVEHKGVIPVNITDEESRY